MFVLTLLSLLTSWQGAIKEPGKEDAEPFGAPALRVGGAWERVIAGKTVGRHSPKASLSHPGTRKRRPCRVSSIMQDLFHLDGGCPALAP